MAVHFTTKSRNDPRPSSGSCSVFRCSSARGAFTGALRESRGYSLVEAVAALTIFGIAIVVAAGFLDAQMNAARRLEARADLVRAAEILLESVRGGVLPMESADIDFGDEFQPLSAITVTTTIEAAERPDLPGLYEVTAVARATVRGEEMVVSISSQVWRP